VLEYSRRMPMSEYSSETCYVCEFSDDCIKSYGNPHDGCTDKFKTKGKPMLNKPEQQVSVVDKDGDLEMLIEIARFEDKEEMKAFETVGWSWRHIRNWPATLERFWRLGYLDRKLNTSSYIGYRLNDKGRIRIYGKTTKCEPVNNWYSYTEYLDWILNDDEIKALPYFDKSRTWTKSLVESMKGNYCEKAALELIKHICQYQIEKLIKLGVVNENRS
jgi:hypothetical protein